MCVVSGPAPEIAAYEESLKKQSIACRRLITSHAFHSAMMEPILSTFEERLRGVSFNPPRIPYLSNVTGTWIKPEEATNPAYWARHIRSTVRFSDNLAELFGSPERVLIEAGPGNVLTTLARQQGGPLGKGISFSAASARNCLRAALRVSDSRPVVGPGCECRLGETSRARFRQRIPLPTYPFKRQKFWIEPDRVAPGRADLDKAQPTPTPDASGDESIWLYSRVWKPAEPPSASAVAPGPWLLFCDSVGVAKRIAAQLKAARQEVIQVEAGSSYKRLEERPLHAAPSRPRRLRRSRRRSSESR